MSDDEAERGLRREEETDFDVEDEEKHHSRRRREEEQEEENFSFDEKDGRRRREDDEISGGRRENENKEEKRGYSDGDLDRRSEVSDEPDIVSRRIIVEKEDAPFILGRGGSTKRKISRVAQADIELDEDGITITVRGTEKQCDRAEDYLDFVRQQRQGPVTVPLDRKRDDFTAYLVPEDCIGFVMGRHGQTLRSMEDEWGVLMFFAKTTIGGRTITSGTRDSGGAESLCIFGNLPARRGAEIKVMSAVEHKHPGYCVSSRNELRDLQRVPGDDDIDGWGTEIVPLNEENYSYALGTRGATRRKLATASGCIVEYVGMLACFVGYTKDRRRGKDYLQWLLEQRTGQSIVENPRERSDCTIIKVPSESVAFITGHRGEALREIERRTGTFCFSDAHRNDRKKPYDNFLLFSFDEGAREYAADLLDERIREHKRIGGPRRPPPDNHLDRRYPPHNGPHPYPPDRTSHHHQRGHHRGGYDDRSRRRRRRDEFSDNYPPAEDDRRSRRRYD